MLHDFSTLPCGRAGRVIDCIIVYSFLYLATGFGYPVAEFYCIEGIM
ncbi:MAG: hypothetical protein GX364_02180 [Firmicutes bacterium]|nr:hypothetical protein [Bacillota bacterium]